MGNWREAAQRALAGDARFPEVSENITSGNLTAETRMDTRAGSDSEVYSVSPVYNPPLHIKSFFNKTTTYSRNSKDVCTDRHVDSGYQNRVTTKTPDKPNKPHNPVNSVSGVNSVNGGASVPRSIVVAIRTGDPAKISAAVAADMDLMERAAMREYEGNMPRLDAELATLLDAIEGTGVVL